MEEKKGLTGEPRYWLRRVGQQEPPTLHRQNVRILDEYPMTRITQCALVIEGPEWSESSGVRRNGERVCEACGHHGPWPWNEAEPTTSTGRKLGAGFTAEHFDLLQEAMASAGSLARLGERMRASLTDKERAILDRRTLGTAAGECAAIVRWLREGNANQPLLGILADGIEAGQHLKEEGSSMAAPYIRPELPSVDAMRARTLSLRKRLDAHAASMQAPPIRRPLSPSELAPALRSNNDQAAARVELGALQENARVELLVCCDLVASDFIAGREVTADTTRMLVAGVQEFLVALGTQSAPRRLDAIKAMREAIASLDRARSGGT